MAVIAAVMAVTGVIAIVLGMQTSSQQAPQPPMEAFGVVEPWRVVPAPVGPVATADPISPATMPVIADRYEIPSSPPTAIEIPAIGAHSTLQYLGLTPDGALEVPKPPRYNEAAWYKYSAEPGSPGPAVILGHVDSALDGPSIFYRLGDVRPGDEILVTRRDGLIAVFVVDGVRSYSKDRFPTSLVYGATEGSTLRVITCGGPWDRNANSYEENIVVFASFTGFQVTPPHTSAS